MDTTSIINYNLWWAES